MLNELEKKNFNWSFIFRQGKYVPALLAILYLFIGRFPGYYPPLTTGLDPSWRYGINYFSHSGFMFGRDVAFTYGPLGYLLAPEDVGSHLLAAVIFRLILHALLVVILLFYTLRSRKILPVILFVLCYTLASVVGIGLTEPDYEYSFLTIICLLVCISWEKIRFVFVVDVVNAVLAGMFLFMKFSLGISSLAIIMSSWLIRLATRDKNVLRSILVSAGTYLLTVLVVSAILFGSLKNFLTWLRVSFAIADGYSVAMSIVGPNTFLILGLIAVGIYLTLSIVLLKTRSRLFFFALTLAAGIFFSFKHGYTRQDGHVLFFFPFLLTVLSILILNSNKTELKFTLISFLMVFALAIPIANNYNYLNYASIRNNCLGTSGWGYLNVLFDWKNVRELVEMGSQLNLKTKKLPVSWLDRIKVEGERVGTLPWEYSYCAANELACDPFPILQMYSAYDASLDRRAAAHYRDGRGPGFILAEFGDVDGRNMLLSTPATWRAILHNYEIVEQQSAGGLHLLKKLREPSSQSLIIINQEAASIGDWISVPASDKALFAYLDMNLRIFGRVSKVAFRIPPVNITLVYESGRVISYRIVPDTAKNGLLINYVATNMEGLNGLFLHQSGDRVVRFRISGPGRSYFHKNISVVWVEDSNYEITYAKENQTQIDLKTLKLAGSQTLFALDSINNKLVSNTPVIGIDSTTEDTIVINGWAVDERAKQQAGGVFINIDGLSDVPATYEQDRPDVAAAHKNDNYRFSGFSASIPTSTLQKGIHTFSLKVVTATKKEYYQPMQKVAVEVK